MQKKIPVGGARQTRAALPVAEWTSRPSASRMSSRVGGAIAPDDFRRRVAVLRGSIQQTVLEELARVEEESRRIGRTARRMSPGRYLTPASPSTGSTLRTV